MNTKIILLCLSGICMTACLWLGCEPSKSGKPDLAISTLELDGDNRLTVSITNEGYAAVTKNTGLLSIFIDGRAVGSYDLKGLSDKSYKDVNGTTSIPTNFRLGGSNRRVAAHIDPTGVISETNEFQNTVSKTMNPPVKTGPDFVISALQLTAGNQLRLVVRNDGNQASAAIFPVNIRVIVNNSTTTDLTPDLPALAPGGTTVVNPAIPISIGSLSQVRALLNTHNFLDETDDTNNIIERWMGGDPDLAPYHARLSIAKVASNMIWQDGSGTQDYNAWPAARKADLDDAILDLENNINPTISAPPALLAGNRISAGDAWAIYIAHMAQCLWVDVHNKVGWDLNSFPDAHLALLLDGRNLLSFHSSSGNYVFSTGNMGNVTSWNPKVQFEFLEHFRIIKSNQQATLYALTDWMRAHLIHISGSTDLMDQYGYAGRPPVDKVLYPLPGKRHITAGCWGTTGLYNALLRTVNIPVESATIALNGGTHSRPAFPSVDKSMPHGDDPYNGTSIPSGVPFPTANIFYSYAQMNNFFLSPPLDCAAGGSPCNDVGEQASYNAGKKNLELAYSLKTDGILSAYATHDAAYMDDYLQGPFIGGSVHLFAKPYFDAAERADKIAGIEARLTEIGDGDIEAGKDIVTARVARWGANK